MNTYPKRISINDTTATPADPQQSGLSGGRDGRPAAVVLAAQAVGREIARAAVELLVAEGSGAPAH
jgi:hypothetical protein